MVVNEVYITSSLNSLRDIYPHHIIYPMGRVIEGEALYLISIGSVYVVKHDGVLYKIENKKGKFVRYALITDKKGGDKKWIKDIIKV